MLGLVSDQHSAPLILPKTLYGSSVECAACFRIHLSSWMGYFYYRILSCCNANPMRLPSQSLTSENPHFQRSESSAARIARHSICRSSKSESSKSALRSRNSQWASDMSQSVLTLPVAQHLICLTSIPVTEMQIDHTCLFCSSILRNTADCADAICSGKISSSEWGTQSCVKSTLSLLSEAFIKITEKYNRKHYSLSSDFQHQSMASLLATFKAQK